VIAQTGALVQRAFNSGATWLLALSAISVPVTLINGVITARALGPSSRGDYAAITAFCTVLIFMACAGVAESMILRSSSTDAASAHQALAWLHSLSLAVVFSVPSAAYAMHVGQDHRIVVFLAMTLPLVGVLGTLSVSHLIAAGSVRFASVIGVIPYVAQMVAMVGVIAIDRLTLVTVLLIYWLSSLLAGVIGGVRLWRMVDRRAQVRRSHIGAFYGELKHLGGSQILRSISSRIDLILVGAMLMSRDTGI
jgi:O-antigen/teichoic acid export membrane protein